MQTNLLEILICCGLCLICFDAFLTSYKKAAKLQDDDKTLQARFLDLAKSFALSCLAVFFFTIILLHFRLDLSFIKLGLITVGFSFFLHLWPYIIHCTIHSFGYVFGSISEE